MFRSVDMTRVVRWMVMSQRMSGPGTRLRIKDDSADNAERTEDPGAIGKHIPCPIQGRIEGHRTVCDPAGTTTERKTEFVR